MIKFQKNKIKILIPIIILLIGGIYFIYDKFNITKEEYTVNKDFILYGTQDENNLNSNNDILNTNTELNKIVIHIIGEVVNQGIVYIDEGARIIDAVNAAGGLTNYADASKVNLAYVLKDGQKVIIPSINEEGENNEFVSSGYGDNTIEENNNDDSEDENGLVNINTAGSDELQTLPGIGESTAKKIVNYRKENGDFSTIEDIKNVSGIGESKFNSIKDMITV